MTLSVIRKLSAYLVVFGLSKSAVLIAPFLAAWTLSVDEYGNMEWWLSLSMTLGPLIAFGSNGVVAFGTLGGYLSDYLQLASRYVVLVACLLMACASVIYFLGATEISIIVMLTVSVMMQLVTAAKLKAIARGARAALAESFSYFAILLAILLSLMNKSFQVALFLILFVTNLFLVFWFSKISNYGSFKLLLKSNFLYLFYHSYKFLFSALLMAFFMAGPRLLIGFFDDASTVATFALIFRWLSISIVIHQFINTIYFRKIYTSHGRDRMLLIGGSCTLVAISAFSIAMALSTDLFFALGLSLPVPPDGYTTSIWIISVAVILWSLSACFEGVLNSLGLMMSQVKCTLLGCMLFIGGAGILLALKFDDPVFIVSFCWMVAFIVMVVVQFIFIVNNKRAVTQ